MTFHHDSNRYEWYLCIETKNKIKVQIRQSTHTANDHNNYGNHSHDGDDENLVDRRAKIKRKEKRWNDKRIRQTI